AQAVGQGVDLAEAVAAVEGLQELAALAPGAADLEAFTQDDGPGDQREEPQDAEDGFGDGARLAEEVEQSFGRAAARGLHHQAADPTHPRSRSLLVRPRAALRAAGGAHRTTPSRPPPSAPLGRFGTQLPDAATSRPGGEQSLCRSAAAPRAAAGRW